MHAPTLGKIAALALGLVFLSGCNTLDRRIERHSELFVTFEPEVQELIRAGEVDIGFTPEMVMIAWGEPDQKRLRRGPAGEVEHWIYLQRYSVYAGRQFAGYQHDVYFDPKSKTHRTLMRPVYRDLYRTVVEETGRVEFRDGTVVSITRAE